MNSDNLPTVENTSSGLTLPLTAMLDNSAIIPMPKISSTINTPKISWAKRSFFIFQVVERLDDDGGEK